MQNDMTQTAGMPHGLRPARVGRLAGAVGQLLVVVLLAVGFFLAPALQGINLEADQSASANAAARAADAAATAEVLRLSQGG